MGTPVRGVCHAEKNCESYLLDIVVCSIQSTAGARLAHMFHIWSDSINGSGVLNNLSARRGQLYEDGTGSTIQRAQSIFDRLVLVLTVLGSQVEVVV